MELVCTFIKISYKMILASMSTTNYFFPMKMITHMSDYHPPPQLLHLSHQPWYSNYNLIPFSYYPGMRRGRSQIN